MNKRSLRILEYNKILSTVSEYAASPMAKRRIERMKPQRDIAVIQTLQEETGDALARLNRQGSVSFSGLCDIGASVKRLEVQGVLTARELLDIASVLQTADNVRKYGDGSDLAETLSGKSGASVPEVTADSLTERFSMLAPLAHISSEIHRCILSENEYADDASAGLKSIRREIRLTNDKLHQQLDKIIKSDETRDQLQDSLITMRGGRYCIPVKQEYRSKFPGMIHDQSATGSTLFIEPMAVVNLNNRIKELANEELLEIERILENLSALAAGCVSDIAYDLEVLTDLDFIFAKAKYAKSTQSTRPDFNTDGIIDIRQGRHPLLERHSVVPVDIRLGEDYTLLIVTGPNTGGKTVSLKTLGLFSLMGQAGLHIPAAEHSRLAVFDDVFADIGDEQSIEQNLSTFSSHMSNIVYIVERAGKKYADAHSVVAHGAMTSGQQASPGDILCLFDEPGGGTDPVEGAALAIAILNYLKDLGVRCMATTHYSELKTYALSTDGVENASCEFDVATLRPTFRLTIGIPGKSNAFAIASRLGLPESIIAQARAGIDSDAVDMETLLADLENARRDMEADRRTIEANKQEIEALRQSLQEKEDALGAKKAEILQKAREEAREIIEDAKEVADRTIRDYNKWRTNPDKADMRRMEEQRSGLRDKLKTYDKAGTAKAHTRTGNHKPSDFHVGDTVLVLSLNTRGTITKLPNAKGVAEVRMGILNSSFPISDLSIIPTDTVTQEGTSVMHPGRHSGGDRTIGGKTMHFSPELNVMGKTVDEACFELDKYLDDAVLAHMSQVTIIHGKGTGALRNGIWQYLKKHPLVRSYRSGEYGEGEYGVTIVEL